MADACHYAWQGEASGRTFTRSTYAIETSNADFSQYDGLSTMLTGVVITIPSLPHGFNVVEAVKEAWIQIRFEAPIMATTIESTTIDSQVRYNLNYIVPSISDIADWTEKTFHHVPSSLGLDEFKAKVASERHHLIVGEGNFASRLYLGADEGGNDRYHLYYAAYHAVTDVRGSFALLDRLLQLVVLYDGSSKQELLPWGSEVEKLHPNLVYAAGLRSDGDSPPVDVSQTIRTLSEEQIRVQPQCLFPTIANARPLQDSPLPFYRSIEVPTERHNRIISLGKKQGTSVTGVIARILAVVSRKHNIVANAKSVGIWGVATDRRARIPERYKPYYGQAIWSKTIYLDNMKAIDAAVTGLLEGSSIVPEFWEVCREFKGDLDKFAVDDASLAISNDLVTAGLRAEASAFDRIPPAQYFYSSYGKIDNTIKQSYAGVIMIHVDQPACMAMFHNVPVIAISSSSWKGSLKIFSQHSRSFYTEERVNALYADVEHCLTLLGRE